MGSGSGFLVQQGISNGESRSGVCVHLIPRSTPQANPPGCSRIVGLARWGNGSTVRRSWWQRVLGMECRITCGRTPTKSLDNHQRPCMMLSLGAVNGGLLGKGEQALPTKLHELCDCGIADRIHNHHDESPKSGQQSLSDHKLFIIQRILRRTLRSKSLSTIPHTVC